MYEGKLLANKADDKECTDTCPKCGTEIRFRADAESVNGEHENKKGGKRRCQGRAVEGKLLANRADDKECTKASC